MQQIAKNWCLVRYINYDEKYIHLRTRLTSELMTHLIVIAELKIEEEYDKSTKQHVLFSVWNEFEYDINEWAIDMMVSCFFESLGVETYSENYIQTTLDLKNESKQLIEVILSENSIVIKDYVLNI